MNEIHVFRLENLLKIVEAVAKEQYDFKVKTAPNGSWNIEIEKESPEHTKF